MQIRWPDLGCFVRGIELGGHICMRTRPLQQLPMVPSRPQSAVLQLSFRCLSKVVLPQKGRQPARPAPWVQPNPDLMCVCTTTTRQLFQSVLSNHWEPCVQTSPRWDPWVIHISIQYNKDMIMDTDTDTLTYLWRIFLKILMKSEVTFFRKSQC